MSSNHAVDRSIQPSSKSKPMRRWVQAAPQIIEQFPAAKAQERLSCANLDVPCHPHPVSTRYHPEHAVTATRRVASHRESSGSVGHIGGVARRIVLEQIHIINSPAKVTPLQEVMAKDQVLGKATTQGLLKGIDIIDTST